MIYIVNTIKRHGWIWVLALGLISYMISNSIRGGDFSFFMLSGERFWNGQNIYKPGYFENNTTSYFYGYPFSMVLSFLTPFPVRFVSFLWQCLNIYFIVKIWIMVVSALQIDGFSKKEKNIFYIGCAVFMVHFINLNLTAGQMTIFLLFISLKSIEFAENKKNIAGASLLAFGIIIKTLPLAILAYILYRGYFRFVIFTIIFFLLYLNMPCWIHGYSYCITQLKDWIDILGLNDPSMIVREYNFHVHNFTALFLAYFTYFTILGIEFSSNISTLELGQVYKLILITSFSFSAFTLFFIQRMPFTLPKTPLHRLREVSYILIVTPLVFPMQQKYAFLFIFPAVAYILYCLISPYFPISNISRNISLGLMTLSFLLFISTIDLIFGERLKNISQYLKLSTFADLLLIPCLALCKPPFSKQPILNLEPAYSGN